MMDMRTSVTMYRRYLERYGIPATLFVVTKYVGSANPYPFDRWGRRNSGRAPELSWRPINWPELEECLKCGLVSVGSHSHTHTHGIECTNEQLQEETITSRDILRANLGPEQAAAYAYPYGSSRHGDVTAAYVNAVKAAGYRIAVSSNLGLVDPGANPLALPRVEATGHDLSATLRAKAMGWLEATRLLDPLRHSRTGRAPATERDP